MAELMERHGMQREARKVKERVGVEEEEEEDDDDEEEGSEEEEEEEEESGSEGDDDEEESGESEGEEAEEEGVTGAQRRRKKAATVEEASSSSDDDDDDDDADADNGSADEGDDGDGEAALASVPRLSSPSSPVSSASDEDEEDKEEDGEGDESESESEEEEEEEDEDEPAAAAAALAPPTPKRPPAAAAEAAPAAADDEDPLSYRTFAAAVGLPKSVSAATLSQRVAAYRAAAGGKLAADRRRGLQALLAHLVRAFAEEAKAASQPSSSSSSSPSSTSTSSSSSSPDLALLDALASEAADVAAEVPYYAVAVARARLDRARRRLLSRLAAAGGKAVTTPAAAEAGEGEGEGEAQRPPLLSSPWPDARDSALIALFCGGIFPLVDGSEPGSGGGHPASAPAALLAAAPLALCPVAERRDVGSGLLLATALQRACEGVVGGGGSSFPSSSSAAVVAWAPEAVEFAADVVRKALPVASSLGTRNGSGSGSGSGRWRLPAGTWNVLAYGADGKEQTKKDKKKKNKKKREREQEGTPPPPLDLSLDPAAVLSRDASYADGDEVEASLYPARCTFAALALLERAAAGQRGAPAAPEALAEATRAVELFLSELSSSSSSSSSSSASSPLLRSALREAASSALSALRAAAAETLRTRSPLFRGKGGGASASASAASVAAAAGGIQTLNPRFDEDFAPGRDADPDRERAAQRALKRSISRERRGAMRELRKDAAFVAAAREGDARREAAERKAARRAGLAFMEQQAADARSGGQGGQWKRRKF